MIPSVAEVHIPDHTAELMLIATAALFVLSAWVLVNHQWRYGGKIINGCRNRRPLMTRWRILTTPWFSVKLHLFHRSDEDRELHDHPWAFVSLILLGGYVEVTPPPVLHRALLNRRKGVEAGWHASLDGLVRTKHGPGSILVRPSRWTHRVELLGRRSLSLVIVCRKSRQWGFHRADGWVDWRTFHGAAGCSDDIPSDSKHDHSPSNTP